MAKRMILAACLLLLGGCALPVPLQIASWAADGISYVMTKKSLTDHGLSMVAQKDCALLRAVTEGTVCRDDDAATMIADASKESASTVPVAASALVAAPTPAVPAAASVDTAALLPADGWRNPADASPEELASFATAAGTSGVSTPAAEDSAESPFAETPKAVAEVAPTAVESKPVETKIAETKTEPKPVQVAAVRPAEKASPPAKPKKPWQQLIAAQEVNPTEIAAVAVEPTATPKLFMVMGSFSKRDNALGLAQRFAAMNPYVLTSDLNGRKIYRVAIGAATSEGQNDVRRQLARIGVVDVWAARMDASVWTVTAIVKPPDRRPANPKQLARVIPPSGVY